MDTKIPIALAASYQHKEKMQAFARELEELNWHNISRWVDSEDDNNDTESYHQFADDDMRDIYDAKNFILFTEPYPTPDRNSRLVEMGMALAYGKIVITIGPKETIYCYHEHVVNYATKEEFLEALATLQRD